MKTLIVMRHAKFSRKRFPSDAVAPLQGDDARWKELAPDSKFELKHLWRLRDVG